MDENTKDISGLPAPRTDHIPGLGLLDRYHYGNLRHEDDHIQQLRQDSKRLPFITNRSAHLPHAPRAHQDPGRHWQSRPVGAIPHHYSGWYPGHGSTSHLAYGESPVPFHLRHDAPSRGPYDAHDIPAIGPSGSLGGHAMSQGIATMAGERTASLKQTGHDQGGGTNHADSKLHEMKGRNFSKRMTKLEPLEIDETDGPKHPKANNGPAIHLPLGQTLENDENVHPSRRAAAQRTVGTIPGIGTVAHHDGDACAPLCTQATNRAAKPTTTPVQVKDQDSTNAEASEVQHGLGIDHNVLQSAPERYTPSVREARIKRVMADTGLGRDTAAELADSELEREAMEVTNGRKRLRGYK